ncbi:MAG TPA: hypothetical protein VFR85_20425 [Anaeromyxobacteraceae bacterium]|nr:hypothetical protein [Anaeromyxobacteraceae bacterium]
MKVHRLLAVLSVANLVLLVVLLAGVVPAQARGDAVVLRGRGLEIVDEQGRVRASIKVHPAGRTPGGEPYPETSILRLIDAHGRPEVKLAAAERGAGLGLAGASDETYASLMAEGTETSLKLTSKDGRQQLIRP